MTIRLLAPEGATAVTIAGIEHAIVDRVVEVATTLVHHLEGHGFTPAPAAEPEPAPKARAKA